MIRLGGQSVAVAWCALLTTLALSSCGSETTTESSATDPTSTGTTSSSASATPAPSPTDTLPPGTPQCTDVWQDGASLPRRYAGCAEGTTFVKRDAMACSSGQRLARYADRFYGTLGAVVHEAKGELDDDPDYRASVRRCRA